MTSKLSLVYDEPLQPNLPPMIILNPRKKIEAEQVPITEIQLIPKDKAAFVTQLVPYHINPAPVPIPKFPLHITWHPKTLCLNLEEDPVISKFWIWNRSERSIYFNCCGLWGDMARLGASWRCFPRTRIWLPPGLRVELFVKATPRILTPIPQANAFMQIAAGHLRDNVTGYFAIPIHATFLKYKPPVVGECE